MYEVVTSPQNAWLKAVRKLQRRRDRDREHEFVVEGEDLVYAGIATGAVPRALLIDAERAPQLELPALSCPIVFVDPALLAEASTLAHAPRVIAIFEQPAALDLGAAMAAATAAGLPVRGPWLALDGLADPGNVGTVLRTAAALGAGGVALLPGTADPFGPKAVRASMGACFRTQLARLDAPDTDVVSAIERARVHAPALQVVALDAKSDVMLWDVPLGADTIIVIGSERHGISDPLHARADIVARIPQSPDVESVNAGVAASIALYDWRRRVGAAPA